MSERDTNLPDSDLPDSGLSGEDPEVRHVDPDAVGGSELDLMVGSEVLDALVIDALIDEALIDEALIDEALIEEALIEEALTERAPVAPVSEDAERIADARLVEAIALAEAEVAAVEAELADEAPLAPHLVQAARAAFARSVLVSAPSERADTAREGTIHQGTIHQGTARVGAWQDAREPTYPLAAASTVSGVSGVPGVSGASGDELARPYALARGRPALRAAALFLLLLGGSFFLAVQGGLIDLPGLGSERQDVIAALDIDSAAGTRFSAVDARGGTLPEPGDELLGKTLDIAALVADGAIDVPSGQALALGFGPSSRGRMLLAPESRLEVEAADAPLLVAGRAVLEVRAAGDVRPLVIEARPGTGSSAQTRRRLRLNVLRGAASLAHGEADELHVSLAEGSRVELSFDPAFDPAFDTSTSTSSLHGGDVIALTGPRRLRVAATGELLDAGAPAPEMKRLQAAFGGAFALATQADQAWIRASAWRVRRGLGHRLDGRLVVQPGQTATLAFLPLRELAGARTLRVALRAPQGTKIRLGGGDLLGGGEPVVLDRDTRSYEPASQTIELPLPRNWWSALAGDEMTLEIHVPGTRAEPGSTSRVASFEGVGFHTGGAIRSGDGRAER